MLHTHVSFVAFVLPSPTSEYSPQEVPAKVLYFQGLAKKAQNAYEQAVACFEAGLKKDPDDRRIRSELEDCVYSLSG